MKKRAKITWGLVLTFLVTPLCLLVFLAGCGYETNTTATQEQDQTEKNQQILLQNQPPERLSWSLERENINRRTLLWNNENKVSYIYLVDFGKVMAFFTIKGKVSSVNSQITNPQQIVAHQRYSGATITKHVLDSPAEDGSYGTNGDAVFFFTTDGTYVEWPGLYMLCDKPLKLSTPPELVRQISEKTNE
jgi:hypothetical protein